MAETDLNFQQTPFKYRKTDHGGYHALKVQEDASRYEQQEGPAAYEQQVDEEDEQ